MVPYLHQFSGAEIYFFGTNFVLNWVQFVKMMPELLMVLFCALPILNTLNDLGNLWNLIISLSANTIY